VGHPNQAKTKEEKLTRSEQAWSMRVTGRSLREIGRALGISHTAVQKLLAAEYKERSAELEATVAQHRLLLLDRLEYVIEQAFMAWERSKGDGATERVTTKRQMESPEGNSTKPAGDLCIVEETTTITTVKQTGNPAYLVAVLAAMAAERQLLGLDAPRDQAGAPQVVVKVYQGVDVGGQV